MPKLVVDVTSAKEEDASSPPANPVTASTKNGSGSTASRQAQTEPSTKPSSSYVHGKQPRTNEIGDHSFDDGGDINLKTPPERTAGAPRKRLSFTRKRDVDRDSDDELPPTKRTSAPGAGANEGGSRGATADEGTSSPAVDAKVDGGGTILDEGVTNHDDTGEQGMDCDVWSTAFAMAASGGTGGSTEEGGDTQQVADLDGGRSTMTFGVEPKISTAVFVELLKMIMTGSYSDIQKVFFQELEYCEVDPCPAEYAAIRERHLDQLHCKFSSLGPGWRPVSRRAFEKAQRQRVIASDTVEEEDPRNHFEPTPNKWYVHPRGHVATFDSVNSQPMLSTTKPKLDCGYVLHQVGGGKDSAIKKLTVPQSYMVFFTFFDLEDFDQDTGWIIDHIDGNKSNNDFRNLWPIKCGDEQSNEEDDGALKQKSNPNVRTRSKLNRNNTSGALGVSCICINGEDKFWVVKAGSRQQDYTTYDSIAEAVIARFQSEMDAKWFRHLSPNHIVHMLCHRTDWWSHLPFPTLRDCFLLPDEEPSEALAFLMDRVEDGEIDADQVRLLHALTLPWSVPVGEGEQSSFFDALLSSLIHAGKVHPTSTTTFLRFDLIQHAESHISAEMDTNSRRSLSDILLRQKTADLHQEPMFPLGLDSYIEFMSASNDSYSNGGDVECHVASHKYGVDIVILVQRGDGAIEMQKRYNAPQGGTTVIHLLFGGTSTSWTSPKIERYRGNALFGTRRSKCFKVNCNSDARKNGLCNRHYWARRRESGRAGGLPSSERRQEKRKRGKKRKCSVADCDTPSRWGNSFCYKHLPEETKRAKASKRVYKKCSTGGCTSPVRRDGLCYKHLPEETEGAMESKRVRSSRKECSVGNCKTPKTHGHEFCYKHLPEEVKAAKRADKAANRAAKGVKQCSVAGCSSQGDRRGGRCRKHSIGKCIWTGSTCGWTCSNPGNCAAQLCHHHAGNECTHKCKHESGCSNIGRRKGGLCDKHAVGSVGKCSGLILTAVAEV